MKSTLQVKIFCLTLQLIVLGNNLFAQQKLTEFSVKIARPAEVFMTHDEQGNIACIFQSNKEYEVDFLNQDYKVIGTAITEKIKADRNQKIIGAVLSENNCHAYFYNRKIRALSCLEVRKSDGQAGFSRIKILAQNEEFLKAFEMEGSFYFLSVPKNQNTVKVLKLNGKQMEEMNFAISMPSFYTQLAQHNDNLNFESESQVGIADISYDMENNVRSTYPSKKLYHFGQKVYITFDEPGITHFIVLDLNDKTADYKKLNFGLERGNNSNQKQGNSFLYRNRFFRATMSPDQMNITILDLDSMGMIQTYNFYPGQDISIANGPLMQEGGTTTYVTDERVLKKSEQFFRRVLDGNLAIAANEIDSSRYEISLGSMEVYQVGRTAGAFGSPGISVGMGFGMGGAAFGMGPGMGMGYPYGAGMYGPGYYSGFPGYYSHQPTTRMRVVYFKSLLSGDDFRHIEGNVPANMKDRINEYEHRVFRGSVPEVIRISSYQQGRSLLLGYYRKNGKRFNIVEFRK